MKKFVLYIGFVLCNVGAVAQQAGFTFSQPSKCAPSTVTFTNTSTGSPTGYSWNFGDGTPPSATPNPQHPYINSGTYTVILTTYYGSTSSTSTQIITVLTPPTFSFTKLNDSICPSATISFSPTVTYPPNSNAIRSYFWDFGDGGSDTVSNPTYRYMNVPNQHVNYTVSLTITDTNGCSQKVTLPNYVYVKPKPEVDFSVDKQYFCLPDTPSIVNFTNLTTNTTNNTFQWHFGDGGQSTLENPTHGYSRVGNYSVSLTVTSGGGCVNTLSKTRVVEVIDFKVEWEVSDTIICTAPGNVLFRGLRGTNIEYTWLFGDGDTGWTTFSAITHTYQVSGTYIATVIADYRQGTCFAYDTATIHLYDSVDAFFSINGSSIISDTVLCDFQFSNPVVFKNITQYSSTDDFGFGSTSWWFGDGDSTTGDLVSHIFSRDTSRYTITMQTVTPYGCLLEVKRTIWYHSYVPVDAGFYDPYPVYLLEGCVPFSLPYITSAWIIQKCWDSKAVTFIWNWGDGSPLDTIVDSVAVGCCPCNEGIDWEIPLTPQHTYTDTGVFFVTLTFINEAGCPYTVNVGVVRVGMPTNVYFTTDFDYGEWCLSNFPAINVYPFDSLDSQGNPIAGVYADDFAWYVNGEYQGSGNMMPMRATNVGYVSILVWGSHNGCWTKGSHKDSIAYACPPKAYVDFFNDPPPKFHSTRKYYYECEFPQEIEFVDRSIGATFRRWFFGDEEDLIYQSTDTVITPKFRYTQIPSYLYNKNPKEIYITLAVYNDDSLDVNSPTYNRCKYCEDTASISFFVSDATPRLTVGNVCQGNEVRFYDTGTYDVGLFSWAIKFTPQNPYNNEYLSRDSIYTSSRQDEAFDEHFNVISAYIDIQKDGFPMIFREMEHYTAVYMTIDSLGCTRWDTIEFDIFSQSKAAFLSGKDGINFTSSKDTLCANHPDTLYLKDNSYTPYPFDTAVITQWKWKIIDIDTIVRDSSNLPSMVFTEKKEGMYDVNLRIVNQYGCITDTLFKNHILINKITAVFSPALPEYCNHTEVTFHNSSYITLYEYNRSTVLTCAWDFGDGTPPHTTTGTESVYHTYNLRKLPDTVDVTLTVWSHNSCSETYVNKVIIKGPIADFIADKHHFPCPEQGRTVNFQNISTGDIIRYNWSFGDPLSGIANESNVKDAMHDYKRAGNYDVTLIVIDNAGCTDTLAMPQHVFIDGPMGDFQYGALSGCVEHTVTFTPSNIYADTITVNPDKANPITAGGTDVHNPLYHTYTSPGAYLPYFYLIKWTDNNGVMEQCVVEWEGMDTIYAVKMSPDFETDSLYCSRSPLTLPNTTSLIPDYLSLDSAVWSYGNGDSSRNINGYVQYDTAGTYTVTMTVYAKNCMEQITKNIDIVDISDTIYTGPDSAFVCGYEITVSLDANFSEKLPNILIPQYEWKFDDGEIIYGNPISRTFYNSGDYPYQLTITFGSSNCMRNRFDTIFIQIFNFPTAEFEAKPQTVNYGEEIHFIDKSIQGDGKLTYWYWNFGDSTDSYLQNPTHGYTTTSGYITVSLWIEDEFGCRDSIEHEVLVLESLEFPNLFTPIGRDGKQYYFRPLEDKGYFKDFQINIYNRWGMLVWENSCTDPNCPNYDNSFWWNGNNKFGKRVEDGVYFWVVRATPLSGGKTLTKNGSVTVIGK